MLEHPILGGSLALLETFSYYDQPILYSAKNPAGDLFLVMLDDLGELTDRWLAVKLDALLFRWMLEGRLDLYSAFRSAESVYCITNAYWQGNKQATRCYLIPQADLSDDRLPTPHETAAFF